MKLIRSKKNSAGKKQAQELYPKVKTFSGTYERSSVGKEMSASLNESRPYPDERPYPVAAPAADVSGLVSDPETFTDPERIDLQDTLLTDESFVERPSKHHPSAEPVAHASVSEGAADFIPSEAPEFAGDSVGTEDPEISGSSFEDAAYEESFPGCQENTGYETNETDSFFETDPDTDTDENFFSGYDADEDNGTETFPEDYLSSADGSDMIPGYDVSDESASGIGDEDAVDSWDNAEPDESTGSIMFKKKKYSVKIGEKTNLKKKLKFCPDSSLKWKSSNKKIAKISRKGILHPRKKGKITVRVKSGDGERAKVKIRIKSAKKPKSMPWENIGTSKKTSGDKRWSYFA